MKKILSTALIATAISFIHVGQVVAQELKLATVDTQKVMKGYWKTKILIEELQADELEIKKDNEARTEKIQKLAEELQKLREKLKDAGISKGELEKNNLLYKTKLSKLNTAQRERQAKIQEKIRALNVMRAEREAGMLKDIKAKISEHSASAGLDLVLDKGGEDTVGVVWYAKKKFDITDTILGLLNAGHENVIEEAKPADDKPAQDAAE